MEGDAFIVTIADSDSGFGCSQWLRLHSHTSQMDLDLVIQKTWLFKKLVLWFPNSKKLVIPKNCYSEVAGLGPTRREWGRTKPYWVIIEIDNILSRSASGETDTRLPDSDPRGGSGEPTRGCRTRTREAGAGSRHAVTGLGPAKSRTWRERVGIIQSWTWSWLAKN